MKTGRLNILAALLVMLPLLASCRQELCYDHYPVLDIKFSWEQEWERDYGQHHLASWDAAYHGYDYDYFRPLVPEWINTVTYVKGGQPHERFLKPEGVRLIVEQGQESSMLLYNGDTEYIVLSDVASLNEARATATSRSRTRSTLLDALYEKHQNARTTNPPDVIYSAFIENVPALKNHDFRDMPIKMQPLVYTYIINFEFEDGLQHVSLARGAVGGMAEAVYLRTGVTSEESSVILFDCEVKQHGCQAHVRSFGAPGFPDIYYGRTETEPKDRQYTVNLELMLRSGKTIEFNYDISDQMREQPRGGVIKITGIRVEDEQGQTNSGFDVDVSGWGDKNEVIDLPIGSFK